MDISKDTVKHIAKLSALAISDAEVEHMQQDMGHILDMIHAIDQVDTNGIEPVSHPYKISQHLRKDTVTEINQRDAFSKLTPHYENGHYLVPKVID